MKAVRPPGLAQFLAPASERLRYAKEGRPRMKATKPRCKDCGFKIRGANHESGRHHQRIPLEAH